MVVFACEGCGNSLKKNQVERHFNQCRSPKVSCIDCSTVFDRASYKTHVKCISEAEKYMGKDYVPKENKGEVKQQAWFEQVQQAIASINPRNNKLHVLLNQLTNYPNIPRKEQKFKNFLVNSLRIHDPRLRDEAWAAISSAATAAATTSVAKSEETTTAETAEEQPNEEEVETSKKTKKSKKRDAANGAVTDDVEVDQWGVPLMDGVDMGWHEREETDGAEDASNGTAANGTAKKTKGKKRKATEEEEVEEEAEEPEKKKRLTSEEAEESSVKRTFKWNSVIKTILRSQKDCTVKLNRLQKKVIAEIQECGGDPRLKTDDAIKKELSEKLRKSRKFTVVKDRVMFTHAPEEES